VTPLELPRELKGPWRYALILTYGANIPFFENAVWSQFAPTCTQKVILADERQFLNACLSYAESNQARYLNQRYVAGGIAAPQAAHAKIILLTGPEQGRLFVGSGNLSWQGYASGGELFTRYDYSTKEPAALNAFIAVREFLQALLDQGMVEPTAADYLRHQLMETLWWYQPAASGWYPVRHNFQQSFLDQLITAVGDDKVEELWILSPFYDPEAIALQRLLSAMRPQTAHLLVQPGQTSVDKTALERAIAAAGAPCYFHPVSKDQSYIHAKLYLLKLANRAICLHGSANLSQAAMLNTAGPGQRGNLELCNLLEGPLNAFDYLLNALRIEPVVAEWQSLPLSLDIPSETKGEENVAAAAFYLIGGLLEGDHLHLYYRGVPSVLHQAHLKINEEAVAFHLVHQQPGHLEVILPSHAVASLQNPLPLTLAWQGEESSNPIFVCNRSALVREIATTSREEMLPALGHLDIDNDLEALVAELESTLVLDRRSVWQLAAPTNEPPSTSEDSEDAAPLSYDQIDYEMLRRHPRLRQYFDRVAGGGQGQRTRLQMMLSAITGRMEELMEVLTAPPRSLKPAVEGEETAESAMEVEAEAVDRSKRQRSREQRLRQIFRNFIRRYRRGISSADFQEFAGFEVMVNNFIIFSHLLWQLSLKDWFAPDLHFLIQSQLDTWDFFWGGEQKPGYFQTLPAADKALAEKWLREHSADARFLAALYRGSHASNNPHGLELRIQLRDCWRSFLTTLPVTITPVVWEDVWLIAAELNLLTPPQLDHILNDLVSLAAYNTEKQFRQVLVDRYQVRPESISFRLDKMARQKHPSISQTVKSLEVQLKQRALELETAVAILQEWLYLERLPRYRICFKVATSSQLILYYDADQKAGWYWDGIADEETKLLPRHFPTLSWQQSLSDMQAQANQVDVTFALPDTFIVRE
jgi:hypothetical protein